MNDGTGFRMMSWNVKGARPPNGDKELIENQVDFIEAQAELPSLLMLNEVTTVQRDLWRGSLQDIGYTEIVDTLDWAAELRESNVPVYSDFGKVNGNLTAVHEESSFSNLTRCTPSIRDEPFGHSELKHWGTNFPEKILNAEVTLGGRSIDLWNIRTVPSSQYGEEKIKIMEDTYHRLRAKEPMPHILAGDFNAPKDESENGKVITEGDHKPEELRDRWVEAELNILTRLDEIGMVDVFRMRHGYDKGDIFDVSFPDRTDCPSKVSPEDIEGRRIDHIFASRELDPIDAHYHSGAFERFDGEKQYSDHAPELVHFNSQNHDS